MTYEICGLICSTCILYFVKQCLYSTYFVNCIVFIMMVSSFVYGSYLYIYCYVQDILIDYTNNTGLVNSSTPLYIGVEYSVQKLMYISTSSLISYTPSALKHSTCLALHDYSSRVGYLTKPFIYIGQAYLGCSIPDMIDY